MKKSFLSGFSLVECLISLALVVLVTGLGIQLWQPFIQRWRQLQNEFHFSELLDVIEVSIFEESFENYFNWASVQGGMPVKTAFVKHDVEVKALRIMSKEMTTKNFETKTYYIEISLLNREAANFQYGIPLWVEVFDVADYRQSFNKKELLIAYPLMKRRES